MLPVNGYQKAIEKETDKLMDCVNYNLSRIRPEKIEKYTVLYRLYKNQSHTLWQLCNDVDNEAREKLTPQIFKIDHKLKVFKRTIEFFDNQSFDADPRICKIIGKLEKICKANGFFNEEEKEKMCVTINRCEEALEDFSPKSKCFNENTKDAIARAGQLVIKSKNTLGFLLDQSKIINFNNGCGDNKFEINEFNDCNYNEPQFEIVEHKVDIRKEPILICLQKTIDALALGTEEGFFLAIEEIGILNNFPFHENRIDVETKGKTLGDRIFFHLYLIHKNESPHLINPNDMNYGTTAFQTEGGCTALERMRAAQRVLADALVNALEFSFVQGDLDGFCQILEFLEEMKLDAKDMPLGIKNLTHGLFGKMYNDYLKAYESKDEKAGYESSWVHPHGANFIGDFGRNAFVGEAHRAVPNAFKLQVIKEFVKSVKENWGI